MKRAVLAVALTPAALLALVTVERVYVEGRNQAGAVVRARRRDREIRRQLAAARVLGASGITVRRPPVGLGIPERRTS